MLVSLLSPDLHHTSICVTQRMRMAPWTMAQGVFNEKKVEAADTSPRYGMLCTYALAGGGDAAAAAAAAADDDDDDDAAAAGVS